MSNAHKDMAFEFLKEAAVKAEITIPKEYFHEIYNLVAETDHQSDVNLQNKIRKIIEDIK